MEPQYIIMSGSEMAFIAQSEDWLGEGYPGKWKKWYYQDGAYLFDTKDEAHLVAAELKLRNYSLLETFSPVSSLVPA